MYRENSLKRRLDSGRKCLGCWLHLESPVATEIVGQAGFDFVIIDHEHGAGDLKGAIAHLQALSATPTTVCMRVPWNDPVYLKRALDIGVEGVMIPMIETAEQARAAVAACRYPPAGIRGNAATLIRAADYGARTADYVRTAADNLVIMCQVETAETIENVEEIAAVEGVDVLFIGPYDLSGSIGRPGAFDDPEVAGLIRRAEDAIRATGKPMAAVPYGEYGWQDLFDRGYALIAGASDVGILREASAAAVEAHRRANG